MASPSGSLQHSIHDDDSRGLEGFYDTSDAFMCHEGTRRLGLDLIHYVEVLHSTLAFLWLYFFRA